MHKVFIANRKTIKFLLLIILGLSFTSAFSQNGTYICTNQGYSNEDKSIKKNYSDKTLITIDINPSNGGSISINNISQEFNFRYDVLSKEQVVADKDQRTITTTYNTKINLSNNQTSENFLLGIVENMDDKSLNFWVFNSKFKFFNLYMQLEKLK